MNGTVHIFVNYVNNAPVGWVKYGSTFLPFLSFCPLNFYWIDPSYLLELKSWNLNKVRKSKLNPLFRLLLDIIGIFSSNSILSSDPRNSVRIRISSSLSWQPWQTVRRRTTAYSLHSSIFTIVHCGIPRTYPSSLSRNARLERSLP